MGVEQLLVYQVSVHTNPKVTPEATAQPNSLAKRIVTCQGTGQLVLCNTNLFRFHIICQITETVIR